MAPEIFSVGRRNPQYCRHFHAQAKEEELMSQICVTVVTKWSLRNKFWCSRVAGEDEFQVRSGMQKLLLKDCAQEAKLAFFIVGGVKK